MGSFDVEVNVDDDELKEYVKDTFAPDDVYVGLKCLRDYISAHYDPEQVFSETELTQWALENDFSKEDD